MKDRFKFRIFDKDDKKIHDVIFINYENNSIEWLNEQDKKRAAFIGEVPTIQCTGLKDKNGKLIYEGDIIKFIDVTPGCTKETSICGVFFKTRGAYYSTIPLKRLPKNITEHDINYSSGRFGVDMCIGYSFLSGEIIGNIYENPELLEEQCANQLNKG